MRPTKNRYFCRACGYNKILFKSEKEALKFLDFNADEIDEETGKKPVRAYFCEVCAGWHVTSRENWNSYRKDIADEFIEMRVHEKDMKILCRERAQAARERIQKELVEIHNVVDMFFEKISTLDPTECKAMANQIYLFLEDYQEKKKIPGKEKKYFHTSIQQCKRLMEN